MTAQEGQAPFFQVSYPGTVRETLVQLHKQAQRIGMAPQFRAALRTLDERLRQDPFSLHRFTPGLRVMNRSIAEERRAECVEEIEESSFSCALYPLSSVLMVRTLHG